MNINLLSYSEFNLNISEINEGNKKDYLSGIVLINNNNNKILLVKPEKYKGKKNKWSIPKGHIDKNLGELENALKELSEETGFKYNIENIDITKEETLKYKKNKKLKILKYYVIYVDKDYNNIPKKYFKKSEIYKAKFMDYNEALKKIEWFQIPILKHLK